MTQHNDASRVDPVPAVDKARSADFSGDPACTDTAKSVRPPASAAPPATWREVSEAVFPDARPMTPEERASFDASVARLPGRVLASLAESGPASDAPAPPRETMQTVRRATHEDVANMMAMPRAASPAQEATPPREEEQHQGWTKNDQRQEPRPSRDATVRLAAAEAAIRNAAHLISLRMEGASGDDSCVAAYRVLFAYLYPQERSSE